MKDYTYNFEIITLVEQFIEAFNDIIIKGYDGRTVIPNSETPVRFIYSPKQRVIQTLCNPAPGGITVPVISVSIASVTRDSTRVFNKNQGFDIPYNNPNDPSSISKIIRQPIPINIVVNMSILTKYQEHLDQILTNFIPYCDPYVVISWKLPQKDNLINPLEIRSEVLWSGSVNVTHPNELQGTQPFRSVADTSFTIKGWFFKKMDEVIKKIYVINNDFFTSRITSNNSILEKLEAETISLSAKPFIHNAFPRVIYHDQRIPEETNLNIDLLGKYFFKPLNVYVTSSNSNMLTGVQTFAPFSSSQKLSAIYTPFTGVKISNFNLIDDRHLEFSLPHVPLSSGYLDVIVQNEAGYGKITEGHFVQEGVSSLISGASGIKFNFYSTN